MMFTPSGKRCRTRTLAENALRDLEEKKKVEAALRGDDNVNANDDDGKAKCAKEADGNDDENSKMAAPKSSSTTRFGRKTYVTAVFSPEQPAPKKRRKKQ